MVSFAWTQSIPKCGSTIIGLLALGGHTLRVSPCVLTQSCLTLCDPMDCNPPDSSVHGIFQARILDWVAISYSRGYSQPRDQTYISRVSCIGRWILYHPGSLKVSLSSVQLLSCTTKNTLPSKTLLQIWWRNQKLSRQAKVKRIQLHHRKILLSEWAGSWPLAGTLMIVNVVVKEDSTKLKYLINCWLDGLRKLAMRGNHLY